MKKNFKLKIFMSLVALSLGFSSTSHGQLRHFSDEQCLEYASAIRHVITTYQAQIPVVIRHIRPLANIIRQYLQLNNINSRNIRDLNLRVFLEGLTQILRSNHIQTQSCNARSFFNSTHASISVDCNPLVHFGIHQVHQNGNESIRLLMLNSPSISLMNYGVHYQIPTTTYQMPEEVNVLFSPTGLDDDYYDYSINLTTNRISLVNQPSLLDVLRHHPSLRNTGCNFNADGTLNRGHRGQNSQNTTAPAATNNTNGTNGAL